jgi:hypothetical protein
VNDRRVTTLRSLPAALIAATPSVGRAIDRARPILLVESVVFVVAGAVAYGTGEGGFFRDFWTYFATGERLNAGHSMYALVAGDRPVLLIPGYVTVPSFQPPFMGLIWQPLARLPADLVLAAWVIANILAVLWATAVIVRRGPRWAPVVIAGVAFPAGGMLAVGNVNGLILAGYTAVWLAAERRWVGPLLGLMAAVKLLPGTLGAYLGARRAVPEVAGAIAVAGLCTLAAIVALGPAATSDYVAVLRSARPSEWSLSGITNLVWLSPAVGVALTVAAAVSRGPAISFRLAVLASVLGGTAVGPATLPLLAAVAIPGRRS